jgi:hypothetical protein
MNMVAVPLQLLSPLQVLVVVDKVLTTLAQCSTINARVLSGLGGQRHADRSRERFGDEMPLLSFSIASWSFNGFRDVGLGIQGCAGSRLFFPCWPERGSGEGSTSLAEEAC